MDLTLAIFCAILAMCSYGLSNSISKPPIRKIGAPKAILFRNITIITVYLAIVLLIPQNFSDLATVAISIAIAAFGYIPFFLFSNAIKDEKVGIIVPIASSSAIITLILASIFYGEFLSPIQLIAICAVFAGVFLISFHKKKLHISSLTKPILLAF
ncbi:MAG: DMT family transporter, partial [Candidatus Micrarchaeota archaeon]